MFSRRLTLFCFGGSLLGFVLGCGGSLYEEAEKRGKAQLDTREKFSKLEGDFKNFPGTAITFRLPTMFAKNLEAKDKKKGSSRSTLEGKSLALGSKNFLARIASGAVNADEVRTEVPRSAVVPPEFPDNPLINGSIARDILRAV
ncbi:MAG: hypothetical protein QM811_14015 [Pirellulales bacterium]